MLSRTKGEEPSPQAVRLGPTPPLRPCTPIGLEEAISQLRKARVTASGIFALTQTLGRGFDVGRPMAAPGDDRGNPRPLVEVWLQH